MLDLSLGSFGLGNVSNPFLSTLVDGADLGTGGGFQGMAAALMGGPLGSLTNPAGGLLTGACSFGEAAALGANPALGSFLGSTSLTPNLDSIKAGTNLVAPTPLVMEALSGKAPASGAQATAQEILELVRSGRIDLRKDQVSGVKDTASAYDSIAQVAAGKSADTSKYGHAKGKQVELSPKMLDGMKALAEKYKFSVSSVAGGKHGKNSRHYAGTAFDVNSINGKKVDKNNPDYKAFMRDAKKLGATEVIGPGSKGHSSHVHVGFPREGEDQKLQPKRPKGTKSSQKTKRKKPKPKTTKRRKSGSQKIRKQSPKSLNRRKTRKA